MIQTFYQVIILEMHFMGYFIPLIFLVDNLYCDPHFQIVAKI